MPCRKIRITAQIFFRGQVFLQKMPLFLQNVVKRASKPVDMNDDFSPFFEFLDRCGPEVRGHGLNGLEAEQVAMIERFIAGRCDDVERRELSEFLQLHPAWIRWIADRVKLAREMSEQVGGESAPNEQMRA